MTKDPVCGMSIEENTAAAKTHYNGTTYFFCAHGCLRAFLKEPEKYLHSKEVKTANKMSDILFIKNNKI
ncbi:MAG: YHS domain-containing protein [Stygiobacter sp.]|nr:MAG: YHS domain-containing protein [Stygiobacter sp.]